jgi:hypothetical protein
MKKKWLDDNKTIVQNLNNNNEIMSFLNNVVVYDTLVFLHDLKWCIHGFFFLRYIMFCCTKTFADYFVSKSDYVLKNKHHIMWREGKVWIMMRKWDDNWITWLSGYGSNQTFTLYFRSEGLSSITNTSWSGSCEFDPHSDQLRQTQDVKTCSDCSLVKAGHLEARITGLYIYGLQSEVSASQYRRWQLKEPSLLNVTSSKHISKLQSCQQ